MRIKIVTLGCKVNSYESEFITELFKQRGHEIVDDNAEVVVINTCSVTNQADAKSRKIIRKEKRENENAIIVACGCMTENHRDNLDLDIDILLGNKDKSKIVDLVENFDKSYQRFYNMRNVSFEDMTIDYYQDKTRAFVKIEDGCNNFCSYCVIPFLRGIERSKDTDKVIDEVRALVFNGHKEIVFTGIHTGNYSCNGKRLVDLIKEVSKFDGLKRIRISSIEITELDDAFLKELKNNSKICNHLHIPLQSGSDKILKLMNRKYDLKYFKEKIKEIRNIRPDINITTDIIVGFPSETNEDFANTLKFSEEIEFGKIHVFPYSKRDRTKASEMPNQVDETIKKERTRKLIKLSDRLENEYAKKFNNKILDVLVEHSDNISMGHTSNYLDVAINKKLNKNNIYQVKVNIDGKITGVIV